MLISQRSRRPTRTCRSKGKSRARGSPAAATMPQNASTITLNSTMYTYDQANIRKQPSNKRTFVQYSVGCVVGSLFQHVLPDDGGRSCAVIEGSTSNITAITHSCDNGLRPRLLQTQLFHSFQQTGALQGSQARFPPSRIARACTQPPWIVHWHLS